MRFAVIYAPNKSNQQNDDGRFALQRDQRAACRRLVERELTRLPCIFPGPACTPHQERAPRAPQSGDKRSGLSRAAE